MFSAFRKDPYAVLKYHLANVVVLAGMLAILLLLFPERAKELPKAWILSMAFFLVPEFFVQMAGGIVILVAFALTGGLEARPWLLGLPLLAAVFAYVSGMLMHNTAHRNVRPRWLNRAIGEACGFHQLGGYMVWTIVHMVHHRYPDDPVYDPHPPGNKTFYRYMRTSFSGLITCMNRLYAELWTDKDPRYARVWKMTSAAGSTARVLRLLVLLFALGPAGWACFYVPSYVVLTLIYWHFNYVTHRPRPDGTMEIRDLDDTLLYRVTNRLLGGFYFHKTHHERPGLFDPYRDRANVRPRHARRPLAHALARSAAE